MKLFCGKYTTIGEKENSLYVEILDGEEKYVETLVLPRKTAFKDGKFNESYINSAALQIAENYAHGSTALIKSINSFNKKMGLHYSKSLKDPFHYYDISESLVKEITKLPELTEEQRDIYNLYKSVKDNLKAFALEPEKMKPEVARRLGYKLGEK